MSEMVGELEGPPATHRGLPSVEMPGWYYEFDGSVVIRTPYATSVVHKNGPGTFPFTDSWPGRHYDSAPNKKLGWGVHNEELLPDEIQFKRFGEDPERYRVVADD